MTTTLTRPTDLDRAATALRQLHADHGQEFRGLKLWTRRPDRAGQFTYVLRWACGCETVECTQRHSEMEEQVRDAALGILHNGRAWGGCPHREVTR
jgi:hypothetical protein